MSTVFTKIINGEIPGTFVWEDSECVVFSTIEPITAGHVLVVPRQEVESFYQCPPELFSHLSRVAQIIGAAQVKAFNAQRCGMIIAGFEVPHLHLHLVPLQNEDQLNLRLAAAADSGEIAAAAEKLRTELVSAGYGDRVAALH